MLRDPRVYYLVPCIGYTCRKEEGPDDSPICLDRREVRFDPRSQGFVLPQWLLCNSPLSEMIPNELVGIEIRSVAGQEMDLQSSLLAPYVLGNSTSDVRWVPVDHQEHRTPDRSLELLEELKEKLLVQSLGVHLVPERTRSVHRRDGVHRLTTTAREHFWCLTSHPPSPTEWSIGTHSRLIEEEDRCAPSLCTPPEERIGFTPPPLYRDRVALVCSAKRLLGSDVELGKKTTNGRDAHGLAELLLDQGRYQLARPESEVESVLSWIPSTDPAPYGHHLLLCQGAWSSGMLSGSQGPKASALCGFKPAVNCRATHAEALDDVAWLLPFANAPDRHAPDLFRSLVRECSAVDFHASIYEAEHEVV